MVNKIVLGWDSLSHLCRNSKGTGGPHDGNETNVPINVAQSVQSSTASKRPTLVIFQQLFSQHRIKSADRTEMGKGNRWGVR